MGHIVTGGFFHGFDFRSTQPCLRVSLKLRLDALGDLAGVDAWLTDCFRLDQAAMDALTPHRAEDRAEAAIDRALVVYGEIARAANLPCFDPGRLVHIEPVPREAGMVVANVALPAVDNVPNEIFIDLFSQAVRVVWACSHNAPDSVAGRQIIEGLEQLIAQLAKRCPFRETTIPICQIAHRHHIPFRHLGDGYMRFGIGSAGQLAQFSSVQRDSAIGATICVDKRVTARALRAAGLPGAEHITVTSREAASAAALRLGWPVVIKPADRERSQGVTAGITDESALLAAYDKARAASANILVERHVAGTCHRILVAAGKVLYVVNRLPKRVKGNGRDTVATLVEAANARRANRPPWQPFKPHILDSLALECLAADGLTPGSVLAEGQFAYIRPLATPEWGGEVEDLAQSIHPENVELAIAATRLLGLTMAGVDLITTDIAQPWYATGAIINEMNFRPQFSVEDREIDSSLLINALVHGTGRIPVHLITGRGDIDSAAKDLKQSLSRSGRSCHSTSSTRTQGPDGCEIPMAGATLFERSLALTMRPDVREMIVAGPPDELFATGLAVDRLDSLQVIDADAARAERLLRQLQARFVAQSASISAH